MGLLIYLLTRFIVLLFLFLAAEVVYRKFRSGNKELYAIFLDSLLHIPQLLKLSKFAQGNDIGYGMLKASKFTRLSDFGSTELMIKSYETCRNVAMKKNPTVEFSPLGYLLTQQFLFGRMNIRLRLIDYCKKHPKVKDIAFEKPPTFVIGFPRTGTTFLHELLGLHPDVRQHYTWEQVRLGFLSGVVHWNLQYPSIFCFIFMYMYKYVNIHQLYY
jgi:hypothetical protein